MNEALRDRQVKGRVLQVQRTNVEVLREWEINKVKVKSWSKSIVVRFPSTIIVSYYHVS